MSLVSVGVGPRTTTFSTVIHVHAFRRNWRDKTGRVRSNFRKERRGEREDAWIDKRPAAWWRSAGRSVLAADRLAGRGVPAWRQEQLQLINFFYHYTGKSSFLIQHIWKKCSSRLIFSLSIWKRRCDVSPFYWGFERNYWGLRKNKREKKMENQSDGVGFFNINFLYWEKVERRKRKINLL